MDWNYIEAKPVAIPASAKTSSNALGNIGKRLSQLSDLAQAQEQRQLQEGLLQSIQARANDTPINTSPTGMVNQRTTSTYSTQPTDTPRLQQGNGLAKVSSKGAEEFMPMFQEAAKAHNVPVNVLLAVAQAESGFNPNAVSSTGVKGLMQVTQDTYNGLGFTGDRANPANSINAGAKLLSQLYGKYGNWDDAFYAYNGGHHGVTGVRQGNWGSWANNQGKQREITNYAPKVNSYLQAWNKLNGG